MIRSVSLLVVYTVLVGGIAFAADEDPVEKNLTVSREEYEKATEKALAGLLSQLKKKGEAAQKAGDFETLEKVQNEVKALENNGALPKSVSVKGYEGQLRTARARLEDNYVAAIKQYTKDGKVNLAKAVQQELDQFKQGGPVKVGGFELPPIDAKEWNKRANGLQVWDVKEGMGNPARSGEAVRVHYTGWLTNGTVFDSSRKKGEPVEFRLTNVIKGWGDGVPGMKVGGVRRLVVPAELAYGNRGAGKLIPPDATLVFEIELLDVKP